MTDAIVVNESFERHWSYGADYAQSIWQTEGLFFLRLEPNDSRTLDELPIPETTERLMVLSFDLDLGDGTFKSLPNLREAAFSETASAEFSATAAARGVEVYFPRNEGFWAQSVAEYALGLTIGALRRIPQTYADMRESLDTWNYYPGEGNGRPRTRAAQFGDDPNFVSGTVAGKRVRVAGMGNIGTRYASFCSAIGADVAGWSASAPDPVYHRSGARRVGRLEELVEDADIFAPMIPHLPATEGIITDRLIDALPTGSLVVCVTRMQILDSAALRRRVLADELALAADVFDIEPLPLGDPLIGRHNVVHTPHNAGRTLDSNREFVESLAEQFRRA
jgi:phosphoglycerate dehydrogenase-like enzyme